MKSQRGKRSKRFADFWIGIPLLYILGLLKTKRRIPDQKEIVGILSLSAIGDTILASAIASDLKKALPSAKIMAFVSRSSTGISRIVEGFDEEVIVPTTQPLQALRIIRQYRTDVLIDICAWPRITALYAALSHARFTVGFQTDGSWRHWAYDLAVKHTASQHEIENFRALLQPFGINGEMLPHAVAKFCPPSRDPKKNRSSVVIFHPWASGFRSALREWPLERWVTLAKAIISDGYHVVITGSPEEVEQSVELSMAIDCPNHVKILAGPATLFDTAMEISGAAAVVCVNTGTMHLAAALNRPTVALHGPTNPRRWGPLGDTAIIVEPPSGSGCGYLNLGFEYPSNPPDCMAKISVEDVLVPLRQVLKINSVRVFN